MECSSFQQRFSGKNSAHFKPLFPKFPRPQTPLIYSGIWEQPLEWELGAPTAPAPIQGGILQALPDHRIPTWTFPLEHSHWIFPLAHSHLDSPIGYSHLDIPNDPGAISMAKGISFLPFLSPIPAHPFSLKSCFHRLPAPAASRGTAELSR